MNLARAVEIVVLFFLITRLNSALRPLDEIQRRQLQESQQLADHYVSVLDERPVDTPLRFLNLTGISPYGNTTEDTFLPPEISSTIVELWRQEQSVDQELFYSNLSSNLHGSFTRHKAVTAPENLTVPPQFRDALNGQLESERGLTSMRGLPRHGRVLVTMGENPAVAGEARFVAASVDLAESELKFDLKGVYMDHGHIVMATSSLKFAGLAAVPYLFPANASDDARTLVRRTLNNTKHTWNDFDNLVENTGECEFVFYGHAQSASSLSPKELDAIEEELANPRGRPVPPYPPVQLTGTLWSPDCGHSFDLDVSGERAEYHIIRTRRVLTTFFVTMVGLVFLAVIRLADASSPSRACRLSLLSVGIQALMDGCICVLMLFMSSEENYALVTTAIGITSLLLTAMFDLQLLTNIFSSQRNDDGTNTAAQPMTDQGIFFAVYSRLYIAIVSFFAVVLYALAASDDARRVCEYVLALGLYSYWLPQIVRNVRRGFQVPFSLTYIISMSVLRLWPLLYVCFVPGNVVYHRYAPRLGWLTLGWQWIQVAILASQSWLGSRWFCLGKLVGYDYHRLLVDSDAENLGHSAEAPPTVFSSPGVATTSAELDADLGVRCIHVDCAICMNDVRLPTLALDDEPSPSLMLERQKYMITPCRHVFHTECLEQWLHSHLQCPVCRAPLPPV